MSRRISQSITPTAEDVTALRGPFTKKGANDPLIVELRNQLNDAPAWLAKLSEDQELTRERLAEIREASDKRRAIIEALPEGNARAKALSELEATVEVVEDMDKALTGASAFGGIS
ncbi:hypothetical protein SCD75_00135 (plasmid) [Prescottella equi]|uniref:Uncharacterized protein n=1 Tax=Rhodococcus hoagii TaxID=43767 RepID=A0A1Z1UX64_RHOHA|nr:hypothetical protein [Prescottella equi]ARX60068.1 hypothetical protein pVAPN1572_0310 [Prescottella equi]WQB72150.1 hypothetical protein SCD75_00135 [Prescottella equi]